MNNAYEVLSDDAKRNRYDTIGTADENPFQQGGGGFQGGINPEDILRDFFGGGMGGRGRGGFNGFDFNGTGNAGVGPIDGNDIEVVVPLTFMESVQGTTKNVNVNAATTCSACTGSGAKAGSTATKCTSCGGSGTQTMQQGFFHIRTTCSSCQGTGKSQPPCPTCSGKGTVKERHTVSVTIPAGIDSTHVLRVAGQGDAGRQGGMPGDIRVRLAVSSHPVFRRDGNDIHIDVDVPFSLAALGGTVTVPTLTGEASLKVDAGIQPNERRVMRGKGIKFLSENKYGNEIVTFKVKTPTRLTDKQRELLEQFAHERGESAQSATAHKPEDENSSEEESGGIFSKLFGKGKKHDKDAEEINQSS